MAPIKTTGLSITPKIANITANIRIFRWCLKHTKKNRYQFNHLVEHSLLLDAEDQGDIAAFTPHDMHTTVHHVVHDRGMGFEVGIAAHVDTKREHLDPTVKTLKPFDNALHVFAVVAHAVL